jgi:pullulanase
MLVAALVAASAWAGPAFLDRLDEVTVWMPVPARAEAVRAQVTVDGQPVPVVRVLPGEPAPDPAIPGQVVLAGTIQRALGGREWDPRGGITRMTRVSPGRYEFVAPMPGGRWEYKVTRGGSWDENWGDGFSPNGPNIVIQVPAGGAVVRFVVDFRTGAVRDSINQPDEVEAPATAPRPRVVADSQRPSQSVRLRLARPLRPGDVARKMRVRVGGSPERTIFARGALDDPAFFYGRPDLGAIWTPTRTIFKSWSPPSESAEVLIFQGPTGPPLRTIPMRRGTAGVWYATLDGNRHGLFYQYRFRSYGQTRTAADVWGKAASADSSRSMVIDLARSNPEGWPAPRPFRGRHTDAVIYEMHIRDFTIDPTSGVRPEWRGKYLGLIEPGTTYQGRPTGLDYLTELGPTHVHLLPFQDFNPAHSKMYNWGYETTLFDKPEEQYSTAPEDPAETIRQTKRMVQGLQRAGIGVVLDVVYNHTVPSEGPLSAFWETAPYFWFRTNDRGDVLNESGVGNAMHDGRPMVRRYVRDSLVFWTREYRLDGFRFDLIGMFEPRSVREWALAVRREFPHAVLYGEPWTGGGPTRFGKGEQRGTTVAVFNDRFRGAFRGELDGPGPGFAMGGASDPDTVKRAVVGSISFSPEIADFAAAPSETINYVSAHDNLTLWDKVQLSMPGSAIGDHTKAVKLAYAAVLLSQGVPFLEGGAELGRDKGGNRNSYDAGDAVNRFDWARALEFEDVRSYVAGLIAIRRAHPVFRLSTAAEVRHRLRFLPTPPGTIAWRLDGAGAGDHWREVIVVLHGSRSPGRLALPPGRWNVAVDERRAMDGSLRVVEGEVSLSGLGATALWR